MTYLPWTCVYNPGSLTLQHMCCACTKLWSHLVFNEPAILYDISGHHFLRYIKLIIYCCFLGKSDYLILL